MAVRLWRHAVGLVALSIVSACPFNALAQSSESECIALFDHYLEATRQQIDFSKTKVPRPGEAGYEQLMAEWKRQRSTRWSTVIDAGRRYLGNCPNGKSQADVLRKIAEGLRIQGHGDDALPIVKRCLSIYPDDSSCWLELGMVEETSPICHDENAKEAFKKVIQIGGFTEVNAGNVDLAKFELEHIDDAELRDLLRSCPTPSEGKQIAPVASPKH